MFKQCVESLVVLRIPKFRAFFIACVISGFGSALIPIAFSLETLQVESLGWGMASVLIGLWGGRFIGIILYNKTGYYINTILVLLLSAFVMGLAQGILLLWILMFENSIIAMTASALLYGLSAAFFFPSKFVFIPSLVDKEYLSQANSLLSISGDIYTLIGPLFGTTVLLTFGFQLVLLIEILTFAVSIVLFTYLYLTIEKNQIATNSGSVQQKEKPNIASLWDIPVEIRVGFLSWFCFSLAIGFFGIAGPTLIVSFYSAPSWAVIATVMAAGSLCGSAASLLGFAKHFSWSYLHVVCGFALGLQLVALYWPVPVWMLCVVGFLGSGVVAVNGIIWDMIGQRLSGSRLHVFASFDQLASTSGIPIGMIIFGVAGVLEKAALFSIIVGSLAFVSVFPVFFYRKLEE